MDSYSFFFFLFFFGIHRWFIGYSLSDTNAKLRRKQSAKEIGKNGVCWRGKWGPTSTLTLLYTALKYALICCAYSLYRNAVSVPLNYIIILFFWFVLTSSVLHVYTGQYPSLGWNERVLAAPFDLFWNYTATTNNNNHIFFFFSFDGTSFFLFFKAMFMSCSFLKSKSLSCHNISQVQQKKKKKKKKKNRRANRAARHRRQNVYTTHLSKTLRTPAHARTWSSDIRSRPLIPSRTKIFVVLFCFFNFSWNKHNKYNGRVFSQFFFQLHSKIKTFSSCNINIISVGG